MIALDNLFGASFVVNILIALTLGLGTAKAAWVAYKNRDRDELTGLFFGLMATIYVVEVAVISVLNFFWADSREVWIWGYMLNRTILTFLFLVSIVLAIQQGEKFRRMKAALKSESDHRKEIEQLERLTKSLKRSNASLEQFAFAASHDLQTPLGTMRMLADLLANQLSDNTELYEYAKRLQGAAGRASQQIDGLLQFSRIANDTEFTEVDLGHVARQAASHYPDYDFEIDDLPTVTASAPLLHKVFINLIDNAVKFQAPHRKLNVRITADFADDETIITVADNGIGIDNEYLDAIFTIFKRLHGASDYSGSGLGLAMVRRIVNHHAGRVWAESTEGEGTKIVFALPYPGRGG